MFLFFKGNSRGSWFYCKILSSTAVYSCSNCWSVLYAHGKQCCAFSVWYCNPTDGSRCQPYFTSHLCITTNIAVRQVDVCRELARKLSFPGTLCFRNVTMKAEYEIFNSFNHLQKDSNHFLPGVAQIYKSENPTKAICDFSSNYCRPVLLCWFYYHINIHLAPGVC